MKIKMFIYIATIIIATVSCKKGDEILNRNTNCLLSSIKYPSDPSEGSLYMTYLNEKIAKMSTVGGDYNGYYDTIGYIGNNVSFIYQYSNSNDLVVVDTMVYDNTNKLKKIIFYQYNIGVREFNYEYTLYYNSNNKVIALKDSSANTPNTFRMFNYTYTNDNITSFTTTDYINNIPSLTVYTSTLEYFTYKNPFYNIAGTNLSLAYVFGYENSEIDFLSKYAISKITSNDPSLSPVNTFTVAVDSENRITDVNGVIKFEYLECP